MMKLVMMDVMESSKRPPVQENCQHQKVCVVFGLSGLPPRVYAVSSHLGQGHELGTGMPSWPVAWSVGFI